MSLPLLDAAFLQQLWAGYGSVKSGRLLDGRLVIEKAVTPPAGSGISHERKLASYHNEKLFYEQFAPHALHRGIAIAQPIELYESEDRKQWRFVLEDLRPRFPREGSGSLDETTATTALRWLADFHAAFLEVDRSVLWAKGTYWHLDTRLDEWRQITRDYVDLQRIARAVDSRLHRDGPGPAPRTLLHGDAKSENFIFSRDGRQAASYDFQYAGSGLGAQDVAYLMASSVQSSVLKTREMELLRGYHKRFLQQATESAQGRRALAYSFEEFVSDYELGVLDFCRFCAGWGWWGNSGWAKQRVKEILQRWKAQGEFQE